MIDLFDIIIISELKYGMFLSAGKTAFALKKKPYVLTLFSFSPILSIIIHALDAKFRWSSCLTLKLQYLFSSLFVIELDRPVDDFNCLFNVEC